MSWITFKLLCAKSWTWLREHWQFPFLILWTVFVYVLSRRNSDAIIDVLDAKKESYKKQLEVINEKHALELLERDKLIDDYHDTIRIVEKEFDRKARKLTIKQKNTVKDIIINSKGDKNAVKEEIENLFNFTYTD